MRAVLCRAWGPPESLTVEDIAPPVAGPGEAVVRVTAAALNFMDTLVIERRYQVVPALPFSPAAEIAGVVESIGEAVVGPPPGTRVVAYVGVGGAREQVAVDVGRLTILPDDVSAATAAGLSVAYGTTLHAYRQRAQLRPGETVAVLGASGGVGQAAIEIAKLMGARVIAAASAGKLDVCRGLGADEVIDYDSEDLRQRLKELTDGRGVDVVYDAVGDRFTEPAVRSLAWGGRLLVVGFAAGEIPKIPINLLLLKGASLVGVFWGRFVEEEPDAVRANMADLLTWVGSGRLTPLIDSVVSLDETPSAIRRLADRQARGKIIVRPVASGSPPRR
jgi:NADPH2:quinone reductase